MDAACVPRRVRDACDVNMRTNRHGCEVHVQAIFGLHAVQSSIHAPVGHACPVCACTCGVQGA